MQLWTSVCFLFVFVSLFVRETFFFFFVTPRSIVNVVIFEKGTCVNEAEKQVITVRAKDSMCCQRQCLCTRKHCLCTREHWLWMLQSQAHENWNVCALGNIGFECCSHRHMEIEMTVIARIRNVLLEFFCLILKGMFLTCGCFRNPFSFGSS